MGVYCIVTLILFTKFGGQYTPIVFNTPYIDFQKYSESSQTSTCSIFTIGVAYRGIVSLTPVEKVSLHQSVMCTCCTQCSNLIMMSFVRLFAFQF